MPTPRELYQAGQLHDAIQALTAEVKAKPSDAPTRIFLFELLSFAGDWDRALKQIDVLGQAGPNEALAVQVYRANIEAERSRDRLFGEGLHPHFLTEPPPYVDRHLEAINRLREGNVVEARAVLDRAEEERPALAGTLNGRPFADFRDCDDVIAPVLELIVKDKYTWLPFEQIRRNVPQRRRPPEAREDDGLDGPVRRPRPRRGPQDVPGRRRRRGAVRGPTGRVPSARRGHRGLKGVSPRRKAGARGAGPIRPVARLRPSCSA